MPPDIRALHFTAAELAELALPGLPSTQQGITRRAVDEAWAYELRDVRGNETRAFAVSSLPVGARCEVLRRTREVAHPDLEPRLAPDGVLEQATQAHRDRALARTEVVLRVADAIERGETLRYAIASIASERFPAKSIERWYYEVRNAPRSEWLARLTSDHRSAHRATVEMNDEAWAYFASYVGRQGNIRYSVAYRHLVEVAKAKGWSPIPSLKTFVRRWEREVPRATRILLTQGEKALDGALPTQRRDRSGMHALELACGDGHRFDVLVQWGAAVVRPIMLAFQDVYSGKILGFRIDRTETSNLVRLALGDVVREHGIPEGALLDNGRAFASKSNTGGMPNRYRFTVREDEVKGVFTSLGIKVTWSLPYRGRSKPIERAWRDLCDSISKHPAFDGAYVGSNPQVKPENAGSRVVPLETFMLVVREGVREHNARVGRESHTCQGRSFDETFAESYAITPIRKATAEQLRITLLEGRACKVSHSGEVEVAGNRYRSNELFELAGKSVTVRYDPDDLHRGLFVYDQAGRCVGYADCVERTGFLDAGAARDHERARRARVNAEKKAAAIIVTHTPAELAAMHHPELVAGPKTEAKTIAPLFGTPRPLKRKTPEEIDEAFEPTRDERTRREREAASNELVASLGRRALDMVPKRRKPLAAGE